MDSLSVRAMDTDTLSQVKEKILEAFCKNVPYSQWPRVEDVDLGKDQMPCTSQSLKPDGAPGAAWEPEDSGGSSTDERADSKAAFS